MLQPFWIIFGVNIGGPVLIKIPIFGRVFPHSSPAKKDQMEAKTSHRLDIVARCSQWQVQKLLVNNM